MIKAFDVIIPTYNNLSNLQKCLRALEDQSHPDFRALVCVDGSTDGTLEWLDTYQQENKLKLKVLQHPDGKNKGRNAARNLALPEIKAPFLAFLDSDMLPAADWLTEHDKMLSENNASVGNVIYQNSHQSLWGDYLHHRGTGKFGHGEELPYFSFVTGNSALPSRCFTELSGQDADMKTYGGGDTEFSIRLKKKFDLKLINNRRAVCWSEMDKSLRFALKQMREFGSINLPYIIKKHPEHLDLFRTNEWLHGSNLKSILMRLALSIPLSGLFPAFILRLKPRWARHKIIAFLVMGNIYRAYRKVKLIK